MVVINGASVTFQAHERFISRKSYTDPIRRLFGALGESMRYFSCLIAALAVSAISAAGAAETAYPTKPIRLISPFAPGGGNDTMARAVGGIFVAQAPRLHSLTEQARRLRYPFTLILEINRCQTLQSELRLQRRRARC